MLTRNRRIPLFAGLLAFAALVASAAAQPAPLINPVGGAGTEAATPSPEALLGERFESASGGLSFFPPAGCKEIKKPVGDEIVEYVSDEKSWILRVTRSSLQDPMELDNTADPLTHRVTKGLVDMTAEHMLVGNNPEVLRKDIINVGPNFVGLVIVRSTEGAGKWLRQQAMVQVNNQLYYIFSLTTPAGRAADAQAQPDPKEKTAVETFRAMIDSIKLIDRTAIKDDQNARLFRTRSLFVGWKPELFARVMKEKQYFLLQREGKNIGYSYAEEEPDALDGNPGVNIYVRTRNAMDKGAQAETGSKMFSTFDLKHEQWARVAIYKDDKGVVQDHTSEWGSSDAKRHTVFNDRVGVSDPNDPHSPRAVEANSHVLDVTFFGKKGNHDPVHRDLPPFYLPQAIGQMLPRLLPLNDAKSYLFASYVNDSREVMMRYVEVMPLKDVTFNGRAIRAVVVSDRIGLEGSPTLHYFGPEGEYLGTENRMARIMVLPTDAQTIMRFWPNAVLTREEFHRPTADAGTPSDLDLPAPQRGLPAPIR